jgi:hypothetical protein
MKWKPVFLKKEAAELSVQTISKYTIYNIVFRREREWQGLLMKSTAR